MATSLYATWKCGPRTTCGTQATTSEHGYFSVLEGRLEHHSEGRRTERKSSGVDECRRRIVGVKSTKKFDDSSTITAPLSTIG